MKSPSAVPCQGRVENKGWSDDVTPHPTLMLSRQFTDRREQYGFPIDSAAGRRRPGEGVPLCRVQQVRTAGV